VLLGHIARWCDQHAVAERDLAEEVLARRVVLLGGVDDGRLIAEGDGLEEIAREQRLSPRALPIFVIVWSMLFRSHRFPHLCAGSESLIRGAAVVCVSRRSGRAPGQYRRRPARERSR
jgi:hypothetical protein